jgi:hypothetical protein
MGVYAVLGWYLVVSLVMGTREIVVLWGCSGST